MSKYINYFTFDFKRLILNFVPYSILFVKNRETKRRVFILKSDTLLSRMAG